MKFAHLADCHIGGWREPELKQLGLESFEKAIDISIENKVGFVIISGDLFNTALPEINIIKETARILHKLKDHDISCYMIAGSHDYSPSGKTMLDVLEKSGIIINVMKFKNNKLIFTEDKTGVKLTGMYGKKGGLEKFDYEKLEKTHLESEPGFKIFLFHTALDEFKPPELKTVDTQSFVLLPKNFNYYAGGHVHYIFNKIQKNYGLITYPGPTFPNNFKELEELKSGGMYLVDDKLNLKHIKVELKKVVSIKIDLTDLTPTQAQDKIKQTLNQDLKDKIVTIRLLGKLKSGNQSEIEIKKITEDIDCFIILKNTSKITSTDFEEFEITEETPYIEDKIIEKNSGQLKTFNKEDEIKLTKLLIIALDKEKQEGEKTADFENRIIKDILNHLENEN